MNSNLPSLAFSLHFVVPFGHFKQIEGLVLVTVSTVIPSAKKAPVFGGHSLTQKPSIGDKSAGKATSDPVYNAVSSKTYFNPG